MFLSRIDLKPEAAANPELQKRLRSAYGIHQVLWDLFSDGPDRSRDFLFRDEASSHLDPTSSIFRAYTLSARSVVERAGVFTVEERILDPMFQEGDRLGFAVRVNPTVRHGDDPRKNKQRHDVVMDAKRKLALAGESRPDEQSIIRGASLAWLARQAERGGFAFEDDDVSVDGYRQHRFRKSGGAEVRLSTVDLEGALTVASPDRFRELWAAGLGPAKGFGCGLILLRRL